MAIVNASAQFDARGALAAAMILPPPYVGPTTEKGTGEKVALHANLNSQMEMLLASGVLVGRASLGYGEAENIFIDAPLKLENGRLSIDVEALRNLLGL